MHFVKSVATNEVFDIADPSNGSSNNREAAIIGLWTGVCGGYRKMPGMLITAVLLANYRTIFSVPEEFVKRVRHLGHVAEQENTRYEHVTRRGRKVVAEPANSPTVQTTEKPRKGLFTRLLRK
uniref:Uncharacterized protein n=1 Tax=Caenorhabditis japonica TaxID=281687 RepID=A0A8R1ETU4_CAEJA